MKKHCIVYAKKPAPEYAKTRLGKSIGHEEAAGIYARLLYHCLLELTKLDPNEISVELALTSQSDVDFFRLAFSEFRVTTQTGLDLGQRFAQSFRTAFNNGSESVIVIGTDIPKLDHSIVQAAFARLNDYEVVIGPDTDGGYYLIGTRVKTAILFENINWSSEFVLKQTEQLIFAQGLSLGYLPMLSDIDTEADFQNWITNRS